MRPYRPRYQPPVLPLVSFDPYEVVRRVRLDKFQSVPEDARIVFVNAWTLASIQWEEVPDGIPVISVHEILNTDYLPIEVFEHIIIHEYTHLLVPPRDIDGKHVSHPPEFWEAEKQFSPLRSEVWEWLYMNFSNVIVRETKKQCIRVKRTWKSVIRDQEEWFARNNLKLERIAFRARSYSG